jgi:hypothetical protein
LGSYAVRPGHWQLASDAYSNLHHMVGFWIAIPLAVVSLTIMSLGFPQQGRDLLSSVAPVTPQQRGGFAALLLPGPRLEIDQVRCGTRVQLRHPDASELTTVMVDDRSNVFLCGIAPAVLGVTGIVTWLRLRTHRKVRARAKALTQLGAAE